QGDLVGDATLDGPAADILGEGPVAHEPEPGRVAAVLELGYDVDREERVLALDKATDVDQVNDAVGLLPRRRPARWCGDDAGHDQSGPVRASRATDRPGQPLDHRGGDIGSAEERQEPR